MNQKKNRFETIDTIRGITLINMAIYHNVWDLVNLFHVKATWYEGNVGYIWQQMICYTFILLSGFSVSFSKRKYRNGAKVLMGGILISILSILFLPEQRVVFGVLTFLGVAILFVQFFEQYFKIIPAKVGLLLSAILFLISRNINDMELGFYGFHILKLPKALYHGYILTFLGFTDKTFFSTDYFSFFPWIFLFLMGFYGNFMLRPILQEKSWSHIKIPAITFLGRHTLILYMFHQPVIYGLLWLWFMPK